MASRVNSIELNQAVEMILTHGVEGLNKAFEVLYNEAMKVERSRYLQAEPYQRTDERIDYANLLIEISEEWMSEPTYMLMEGSKDVH